MPIPNNGTIEDVINLLNQTQGINQKIELAGVIGEPARPSDNISTQIGILSDGKELISNNIVTMGGTSLSSDSINDIAQSILTIPTGVKIQTGTSVINSTLLQFQYYSLTSNATLRTIRSNDLNFEPSMIIALSYVGNNTYMVFYSKDNYNNTNPSIKTSSYNGNISADSTTLVLKGDAGSAVVNSTSFILPIPQGGNATEYIWIAIG